MTDPSHSTESSVPAAAQDAVLVASEKMPDDAPQVTSFDLNDCLDSGVSPLEQLLDQYKSFGFQATNFGLAVEEVNKMIAARYAGASSQSDVDPNQSCKIFLGYTSNMASAGVRDLIRFLVQHKLVDVVVTTGGGIEEDFIKCLAPTYLGSFDLKGEDLRRRGLNRIGNLLVPNDNYCKFEDWLMPILDAMVREQEEEGKRWTPSLVIDRLGKEINDERSIYYWCHKNGIPVFCPALTDGSIGDMMYFHTYKTEGLVVDIVQDIRRINDHAVKSKGKTGAIIIGGGLVKHHILNANLMRNGADYAVLINTAQEFDGSDSGARPDEAISWGKLKIDSRPVKVYSEATLVFPLLIERTFLKLLRDRPELRIGAQSS